MEFPPALIIGGEIEETIGSAGENPSVDGADESASSIDPVPIPPSLGVLAGLATEVPVAGSAPDEETPVETGVGGPCMIDPFCPACAGVEETPVETGAGGPCMIDPFCPACAGVGGVTEVVA